MDNDISKNIEKIEYILSNIPKSLTPEVKMIYITFDDNFYVKNLLNTGLFITNEVVDSRDIRYYLELENTSFLQGLNVTNIMVSYNEIDETIGYKPQVTWLNPVVSRSIYLSMFGFVYSPTFVYKLIDPNLLHMVIYYVS